MNPAARLMFEEWSPPWLLTMIVVVSALIYVRGWFAIRKTRVAYFPGWRLASYLLGLLALWLALGTPLDGFADVLLSAHMVQHLVLISFVPPLLLLGAPVVPILRGLPPPFVRIVLGPLFRSMPLLQAARFVTRPMVAWLAMNLAFLVWHTPAAYDFALRNAHWHEFEHTCFLATSLLFWWPVIQPWPARRHNFGWGLLLYLLAADFVNTALSAFLAFCDRPVYTFYLTQPNPFHVSPLSDQVVGAVIMWVLGSILFLLPAVILTWRLLQGRAAKS